MLHRGASDAHSRSSITGACAAARHTTIACCKREVLIRARREEVGLTIARTLLPLTHMPVYAVRMHYGACAVERHNAITCCKRGIPSRAQEGRVAFTIARTLFPPTPLLIHAARVRYGDMLRYIAACGRRCCVHVTSQAIHVNHMYMCV